MAPFGQVIPVTGPYLGFPGKVTRLGKRGITARQVLATTPNNIPFGMPVVIIPTAGGGDTVVSVVDYVGTGSGQQSGTFTAAKLAGVAIAEVTSNINYASYLSLAPSVGFYAPGLICEFLEEGSIAVQINNGTPASQGIVYVRIALNGAIPAGVIGDFEAVADGANTVALSGVIFRTGVLDANNMAEITLLNRVAA
jgi:hypothetical protein